MREKRIFSNGSTGSAVEPLEPEGKQEGGKPPNRDKIKIWVNMKDN